MASEARKMGKLRQETILKEITIDQPTTIVFDRNQFTISHYERTPHGFKIVIVAKGNPAEDVCSTNSS